MKKVCVALFLTVLSVGAMAEWVKIGGNDKSSMYADPSTIRRSGYIVKMWSLLDLNKIQSPEQDGAYISSIDQSEYDCRGERARTVYFTNHSGRMGDGEVAYTSNTPLDWTPISPGSLRESLWKLACSKK